MVLAYALQHEVPVGSGERLHDADAAPPLPFNAQGVEVGHDVGHGHRGVQHGNIDVLADAGVVPVAEGGQYSHRAEESRADIAQRTDRVGGRRPPRGPFVLVDPGHALDDRRIGAHLPVGRGRVLSESGDRQVYDCWVSSPDRLVADA